MSRKSILATLFLFIATTVPALAAPLQGGNQASAKLFQQADGDCLKVAIEIEIGFGWHLYHDDLGNPDAIGKPTVIELKGEGLEFSDLRFPKPQKLDQPGLGTWINGHDGTIVIYASARGNTASPVSADLSGLTCEDAGTCVLYNETVTSVAGGGDLFSAFPADLCGGGDSSSTGTTDPNGTSGAHGTDASPSAASGAPASIDYDAIQFADFKSQTKPIERSLVLWLLIAFLAGMILNVMPCVLPVISIKVLSFVQQAGEDRGRIFKLGLAFAAGIVVVFMVLAALALSLNLSWGQQFQSPQFLVVMIGIVFAFALSMFGVYELGVPQAVGAAASGPPREGLVDAFFKGMLATLLATPCSGPFLGTTLTWTLSQPPVTVVAIFLSLGLGMACPYVILTAQPALLKFLPKPGAWMETFKQAMGFVLMATVVYLMISLRQDLLLFTIAFLVFVAMGCWWWGRFATFDQSSAQRLGTFGMSVLIVALGAQLSFKSFRGLFQSGDVEWIDFDPIQFQEDMGERSVFIDFTADWCPNCKYNETFVYDSEAVQEKFAEKGVVIYKADITHKGPRTSMLERLMSKLGTVSIPFMAVFPHDQPGEPLTRFAIVQQADMLSLLDSLPAPK